MAHYFFKIMKYTYYIVLSENQKTKTEIHTTIAKRTS